jgi:hypothetical protein
MNPRVRRFGYLFLCAFPILAFGAVAAHPLRVAGVHQVVGGVLFTAVVIAAWVTGADVIGIREAGQKMFALSGILLILPFAIIALLWVGIGAPFQATISENYMRFIVLVWDSILVTSAFIVLKEALYQAGERFYSTAAFATALLAGAAYLVCLNMSLAYAATILGGDKTPPPAVLGSLYSALEFVACLLTYVTTALFATALGRAGVLGRGAARAYMVASAIFVLLLVMRGLAFPEISGNTAPWYTRPGVIAGIPAIPWLMPGLLGAVLLRRAGEGRAPTGAAIQPN